MHDVFDNLPALDLLAIAAHPDDVEQTCGGTIIRMAEAGYRCGVLDLTAGVARSTTDAAVSQLREVGVHLLGAPRVAG